jgi:hypothetical protein
LPLLKGVKSWRKLAKQLINAYDKSDQRRSLISFDFSEHDLDDLQHRQGSNESCLKTVIEIFLQGRGRFKQPSWRAVLLSLCNADELQLATSIKTYAEPLQGVCIIIIDGRTLLIGSPFSMILNHYLNVLPVCMK